MGSSRYAHCVAGGGGSSGDAASGTATTDEGGDRCDERCFRRSPSLWVFVAPPAGAIAAFVTGTVTEFTFDGDETTPYLPALPSIAVGDAFQVTITYEQFPCGSPLALCTHNQTFY